MKIKFIFFLMSLNYIQEKHKKSKCFLIKNLSQGNSLFL